MSWRLGHTVLLCWFKLLVENLDAYNSETKAARANLTPDLESLFQALFM